MEPAFDPNRAAFLQMVAGDLSGSTEENDAMPFRFSYLLVVAIAIAAICGNTQTRNGAVAVRRVAHFWIRTEIAGQDHLIH